MAETKMNRTVLNADVLLLVFSLAHKQTKLDLMSTCKVLYREGGKQFLKDADRVRIGREPGLESFLRFMDADGGSRMRHLRQLTLDINLKLSPPVAKRFEKMLNSLAPISRLAELNIISLEPLLSTHPSLARAIADFTSIKTIHFYPVGRLSIDMLQSMQSELETVKLEFAKQLTQDSDSQAGDRDPIMLLRPFSASLRYLSVGRGVTVDPQDDTPQYPHVSHLTLDEPASPITWHYVRAFPKLRTLAILTWLHGTYEAEEVGVDQFRAENEAQLRRHGCWKSLDRFVGTIVMLWLLGLPCPVSRLRLHDACDLTPDILRDALVPAQATRLDISFYQFGAFLDEEFTRTFAEACGATLKVLELMLDITPDEYMIRGYDLDLGDVLDAIIVMLRSFSTLESMTVELRFPSKERCSHESLVPGEVYADEMDVNAMCAALREAVPSASRVRFEMRNHHTRGEVKVEMGSEATQ